MTLITRHGYTNFKTAKSYSYGYMQNNRVSLSSHTLRFMRGEGLGVTMNSEPDHRYTKNIKEVKLSNALQDLGNEYPRNQYKSRASQI